MTMKGNFIPELQDTETTSQGPQSQIWRTALDLDAIETSQLSLLERAQLFVKLKFGQPLQEPPRQGGARPSLKELFNQTKFKTVRNTMLSDSVLPPKGRLIQICKQEYQLDYARLNLIGIPVLTSQSTKIQTEDEAPTTSQTFAWRIPKHKDRVIMAIYMSEMVSGCRTND